MVVPRTVHLRYLRPFVLGNFVHLTLLRCLVRVLGADGEEEILRPILKPLVKVGKLVTRAAISHRGLSFNFICLLVDDEGILRHDCSNLIFFLLSTDAEHLVMDLDACEVPWQNVGVAQSDL